MRAVHPPSLGPIVSKDRCGGLQHEYLRAAAGLSPRSAQAAVIIRVTWLSQLRLDELIGAKAFFVFRVPEVRTLQPKGLRSIRGARSATTGRP